MHRCFPTELFRQQPSALLIIDMQRDFLVADGPLPAAGGLALAPIINRLTRSARENQLPVIFTHEVHRAHGEDYGIELEFDPQHCQEGSPGAELLPALEIEETDLHIYKRRYDAFIGTDLDLLLRSLNIKNLYLCGVDTDICVLASAVSARNYDYRVALIEDACAGSNQSAHEAALVCLSTVFGYLIDANQVVEHWQSLLKKTRLSPTG